jgi:hypothetical protein
MRGVIRPLPHTSACCGVQLSIRDSLASPAPYTFVFNFMKIKGDLFRGASWCSYLVWTLQGKLERALDYELIQINNK